MVFRSRHQFMTVEDVPKEYFKEHVSIYAFCERVIDGDTIRVRHLPKYSNPSFLKKMLFMGGSSIMSNKPSELQPLQQRALSDCTLSIRIYGVDCPEMSKSTKQASQPFAEQAKQFATDMVLHHVLKITFLRKDQYRRAVAVVETVGDMSTCRGMFPGAQRPQDLSVELAKAGLAELYTAGGAEYYNQRDLLERCIAEAQRKKLGIWSLGENFVSAAEFKRNKTNNNENNNNGSSGLLPVTLHDTTNSQRIVAADSNDGYKNYSYLRCLIDRAFTRNKSNSNRKENKAKKNVSCRPCRGSSRPCQGTSVLEAAVTGLECLA